MIARTSIMKYKATDKSIAEIGRELNVGTILEGSVRKAGDQVRIAAQLIDVESEAHLWSEDYDRALEDMFAIQSDVAEHVAQALQITLKPAEAKQLAKAGTGDHEAYDLYLRGLFHFNTVHRARNSTRRSSIPSAPSRGTEPLRGLMRCWPGPTSY